VPGALGPVHPDRLSLWPVEGGRYGIDVSFTGKTGLAPAERWRDFLAEHGMAAKLIQELGGAWTVRVGPVARDDAQRVVGSFLR
jgi:hypothetical protein